MNKWNKFDTKLLVTYLFTNIIVVNFNVFGSTMDHRVCNQIIALKLSQSKSGEEDYACQSQT